MTQLKPYFMNVLGNKFKIYSLQKIIVFFLIARCSFLSAAEIAVVTMAIGKEYSQTVDPSIQNKKLYCQKHGYDFICSYESLNSTRPIPWSKIQLLLKVLSEENHKWVFWTDADSLIMNDDIRLEELIDEKYDFIVCGDHNTIDPAEIDIPQWKDLHFYLPNIITGEFFLKNSDWSKDFLSECYLHEQFIHHPWWEQAAIMDMLATDKENRYLSKTKIIPYRLMGSFPEGHSAGATFVPTIYKPGDFILHFAGTRDQVMLKNLLDSHSKLVIHDKSFISLKDYFDIYGYTFSQSELNDNEKFSLLFSSIGNYSQIEKILLINFNTGASAVKLLNQYPKANLIAVDQNIHHFTSAAKEYCQRWFGQRFTYYQEGLKAALTNLSQYETFDVIFFNTSFPCESIVEDFISSVDFARSDTILVVWNYELPEVYQAIQNALKRNLIKITNSYSYYDSQGKVRAWVEAKYTRCP